MMRFEKATGGWVAFKTNDHKADIKIADIQIIRDVPFVTIDPQIGMVPGSAIQLLAGGLKMLSSNPPHPKTQDLHHVGVLSYFLVQWDDLLRS